MPMYVSEIAPLTLRGCFGTVNQLAVTIGILVSQILGIEDILGTEDGWPVLLGKLSASLAGRSTTVSSRDLSYRVDCVPRRAAVGAVPHVPRIAAPSAHHSQSRRRSQERYDACPALGISLNQSSFFCAQL